MHKVVDDQGWGEEQMMLALVALVVVREAKKK